MTKNKFIQIANYLEELSWLLENNKGLSLKEVSTAIKQLSTERTNITHSKIDFPIGEEGKTYLVGVLPKVLQDNDLFKSNAELLDFAELVLQLKPSRAAKRSRIEYIGWIVCEVSNTKNKNLNELYKYLRDIFSDENSLNKIKQAKKDIGFSWNEVIRTL